MLSDASPELKLDLPQDAGSTQPERQERDSFCNVPDHYRFFLLLFLFIFFFFMQSMEEIVDYCDIAMFVIGRIQYSILKRFYCRSVLLLHAPGAHKN